MLYGEGIISLRDKGKLIHTQWKYLSLSRVNRKSIYNQLLVYNSVIHPFLCNMATTFMNLRNADLRALLMSGLLTGDQIKR